MIPLFAEITQIRNVRAAKLGKSLTQLVEHAAREIEDADKGTIEQLAYDDRKRTIVILNEWVKAGESPLLVGHQGLCQFLRSHLLSASVPSVIPA